MQTRPRRHVRAPGAPRHSPPERTIHFRIAKDKRDKAGNAAATAPNLRQAMRAAANGPRVPFHPTKGPRRASQVRK